eukprot:scaffold8709_cov62-Phaeocystis_antarctica.AAC.6
MMHAYRLVPCEVEQGCIQGQAVCLQGRERAQTRVVALLAHAGASCVGDAYGGARDSSARAQAHASGGGGGASGAAGDSSSRVASSRVASSAAPVGSVE